MKAVFLDRDGIININKPYISDLADIEYVPDVFNQLKKLTDNDYSLFIVTNQGGVGLGKISEEQYCNIEEAIERKVLENGSKITETFSSFFHPKAGELYTSHKHLRKPNSGMIQEATKKYNIQLDTSYLIGDKMSDIAAGNSFNVESLLIRNEFTCKNEVENNYKLTFSSLGEAVNHIISV